MLSKLDQDKSTQLRLPWKNRRNDLASARRKLRQRKSSRLEKEERKELA